MELVRHHFNWKHGFVPSGIWTHTSYGSGCFRSPVTTAFGWWWARACIARTLPMRVWTHWMFTNLSKMLPTTMILYHYSSWIVGQSVMTKYFASTASILGYTLRKFQQITIHQIDRYSTARFHSVQNRLSFCLISRNLTINIYKIITASIVLHRCETSCHSPRKEYILYVLVNKWMRKILGPRDRK